MFSKDIIYDPKYKLNQVYDLKNTKLNRLDSNDQLLVKNKVKCWQYPTSPLSILSVDIFNALENDILSNYNNMNIMDQLFEMQRVYHRSIFDCFNESLSRQIIESQVKLSEMLFSDKRKPTSKNLTLDQMLIKAMEDVLDCASLLCGIIKDKEDSMMGNIRLMDNDLINQLREERMFRMIALENIEKDKAWFNYDNHETLVKLQISESIVDKLMTELIYDLNNIHVIKNPSKYSSTNPDNDFSKSNMFSQKSFKVNSNDYKWDIADESNDYREIGKSKSNSDISEKSMINKLFSKEGNGFKNNLLTVDYKNMLFKPKGNKLED